MSYACVPSILEYIQGLLYIESCVEDICSFCIEILGAVVCQWVPTFKEAVPPPPLGGGGCYRATERIWDPI